MKKLFIALFFMTIGIIASAQYVTTQPLKGKPTRVYVSSKGIAYRYYSSLKIAKTQPELSSPEDKMIIVTGKYNFWAYDKLKNVWKKTTL